MSTSILTPRQIAVLSHLGQSKTFAGQFYLTGGTALAAFYLHHRFSEDLDFFSEQEVDATGVRFILEGMKSKQGVKQLDYQQTLNRNLFFLDFGDETIKTEFTYFPFPRIEPGQEQYGVSVDSITDIAVNKLFSVYQRTKARDYIDLYAICQKYNFTIDQLIKLAKSKFDWHVEPLQLATQFVKAEQAEEYPRMIEQIDDSVWQNFFRTEAKKLKNEILS